MPFTDYPDAEVMERAIDQLAGLKLCGSFKKAVRSRFRKKRQSIPSGPYENASIGDRIQFDHDVIVGLSDLLEEHIISKLTQPAVVLDTDIHAGLFVQVAGVNDERFDEGFTRFVEMLNFTCGLQLHEVEVKFNNYLSIPDGGADLPLGNHPIAFTCSPPDDMHLPGGPVSHFTLAVSVNAAEEYAARIREVYPVACEVAKLGGFSLFWLCILTHFEWYVSQTGRERSLRPQLRNAVHMLVEGFRQQDSAISLSLYFSGLEALVCQKTVGIVDELASNLSALLIPRGPDRVPAKARIKKLYNLRSKTLHGEQVALSGGVPVETVFRLLSVTLAAVAEWQKYQESVGDEPSRDNFLHELSSAFTAGTSMVGVPEELGDFLLSE